MSITSNQNISKNIGIVLVSPQIPDNVGLVSRVMKNTGFHNLSVVTSQIEVKSFQVAKSSRDLLEKAKIFPTLKDALADSQFVFGTSRRKHQYQSSYDFSLIKPLIVSAAQNKRISIVFGREDFGLSGEETRLCDSIFYIPSGPDLASYNLAFAVGIVCYELFDLVRAVKEVDALDLAKRRDIETLWEYFEKFLAIRLPKHRVKATLESLKRLFNRTHLTRNEVSMLKSLIAREK